MSVLVIFLSDQNQMMNFVDDLLNIIPAKFGSNQLNSFRGEEESLQVTDGQTTNYD